MTKHSETVGGSSAGPLIACPGRYRMSKQAPPRASSSYADEGSMLHSAMEKILLEDIEDLTTMIGFVDPDYPDHVLTQDLLDEMVIPALKHLDAIAVEYGEFEFDIEAEVVFKGIDGAFGTADIVGFNEDYTFVIDWKFGRGVPVSAEKNTQLMFYTYAASTTPAIEDMFNGHPIVQAIIQPAVGSGMSIYETDMKEVKQVAKKIKDAWKLAQEPDAPLNVGDHCRFCPALSICPERRKGVDLGLTLVNKEIKVPELGDLLLLCEQLEPWIKEVKKVAHAALERGEPVTGFKLVPKRATRKWTDEDAAIEEMSKSLDRSDLTVEKAVSPAQAEKLFKKQGLDFDLMKDFVVAASTGNTMAPESDPRPDAISTGRQGVSLGLPDSK